MVVYQAWLHSALEQVVQAVDILQMTAGGPVEDRDTSADVTLDQVYTPS